jgi:hypothetical protein
LREGADGRLGDRDARAADRVGEGELHARAGGIRRRVGTVGGGLPPPEDQALARLHLLDDGVALLAVAQREGSDAARLELQPAGLAEPLGQRVGIGEGIPRRLAVDGEGDVSRNHGVA